MSRDSTLFPHFKLIYAVSLFKCPSCDYMRAKTFEALPMRNPTDLPRKFLYACWRFSREGACVLCMRFAAYFFSIAVSIGIVVPSGGAAQRRRSGEASPAISDFSGTVEIGNGHKLYIECHGGGPPTVILESGLRTRGDNWSRVDLLSRPGAPVSPEVAKLARVCTYDRPGTTLGPGQVSRSDPASMPRTAMDVVHDLHALLHAADIPGPYVFVGHSFGGLFARLYNALYPQEVSGLVLVDTLAEQIRPLFKPADWAIFLGLNSGPLPGFEKYTAVETIDFDASIDQMIQAEKSATAGSIPIVILVRGLSVELPPAAPAKFGDILERAWRKSEDQLAEAVPHTQFVVAKKSGHYIQWDEPALVVQAIRDVMGQAPRR
jgi:pimeloyl-ACP methyl ester carboxylesterase